MLLRLEREGVYVDSLSGDILMMLERLNQVKVASIATRKPVMAVKLKFGPLHGVISRTINDLLQKSCSTTSGAGSGLTNGGVLIGISEIEPLLAEYTRALIHSVILGLNYPDQFFTWMIEGELEFIGSLAGGLSTGILQLFDQIFVTNLGKPPTLVRIEVDIVHPQGARLKRWSLRYDSLVGGPGGTGVGAGAGPEQIGGIADVKVDLDFVVLYDTIPLLSEYLIGTRLYLKLSSRMINSLKPKTI